MADGLARVPTIYFYSLKWPVFLYDDERIVPFKNYPYKTPDQIEIRNEVRRRKKYFKNNHVTTHC